MAQSKYDSYSGSSSNDDYNLKFTPETSIETTVGRVFGTSSEYGQSLGVVWEDIEVTDGCLYYDAEKDGYKLFSWKKATGLSPFDALERGQEPSVDDADDVISKTYGSNDKTYDLVAARLEEVQDENGDVIVEAQSKSREVDRDANGTAFTDWTDHGGDAVPVDWNGLTWFSGSKDYGPSVASQRTAKLLTEYGEDVVVDEDDVHNWLTDTSGSDILRDDLAGRRIEYFMTIRESDDGFNYYQPHAIDVGRGIEVEPIGGGQENAADDDSSDDSDSSGGGSALVSSDPDSVPEPVADFITSSQTIELDEQRAEELLNDTAHDPNTGLTEDMIDEAGGADAIIEQVV